MEQVQDFLEESRALAQALQDLPEGDWDRATQFKQWTVNDVICHLHLFNRAADLSLHDPEGFGAMMAGLMPQMIKEGMRPVQAREVPERGRALLDLWQSTFEDMAARWAGVDPKTRVKWVGPDMSVRSSITARQMETWAHGMEVFDLLGFERAEADRIANIVMLGVNTFGFSHQVQGLEVPDQMPFLRLEAPSGAIWTYGAEQSDERIEGPAVAFAQVVTQTRNIADVGLRVSGPVATRWMATAQCFAGAAETPPAAGTRFVQR